MTMITDAVIETTDATFQADVIEGSHDVPVVVDFWAPWCGPCRALGPILERLAAQAGGTWRLAKVNVDENQALAQQFRVQGIPAVKGFRDGRVVADFTGAQPESAVRAFLTRLIPSEADRAASDGRRLLLDGQLGDAEVAFSQALNLVPNHPAALLGLGTVLEQQGRMAEAVAILERLPAHLPEGKEAAGLLQRARFAMSAVSTDALVAAQRRVQENPDDLEARWVLATDQAARGNYASALEHFLAIVEKQKAYRDGAARTSMLAIFSILGPENPTTQDFRKRLAMALFS